MTAKIVATVILEVYSNGHVKEGSKKLEYEDFLQMVHMAKGALLYDLYKLETAEGFSSTLNSMIKPYVLPIKEDEFGDKFIDIPGEVLSLPDNAGIYSITPLSEENNANCLQLYPSPPGSESAICRDDSGASYYIPYGNRVKLLNLPDWAKKVKSFLALNEENSIIPDNISFKVCQLVWREALRTITLPIDKTKDQNPNIDDMLKTKLSAAQLNA